MPEDLAGIAEDSTRGGFFLFVGNAVSILILAIGSIVIARLLGPANYGLYSISLAAPAFFLMFTSLGVDPAVTRYSAMLRSEGRNQEAASMLRSSMLFKLLTAIVMFIVCFTLADSFASTILNRPGIGDLIRFSSAVIVFQAVFSTTGSAFMGLDRVQDSALTMIVQAVVKAVAAPLLILLGLEVVGALTGHILGYAVATVAAVLILFLKHYRDLGGASKSNSLSTDLSIMLRYGFPIYFSALLTSVLGSYQSIVLAHFVSNTEIGNLGVAMEIATMVSLVASPAGILFATFSKVDPKSSDAKDIFRLSIKYTSLLIIPAATVVIVLSKDLVLFFYGGGFSLAPLFLSIYVLTYLYVGLGSMVLSNFMSGVGESKTVLTAGLINLVAFIPLAPILAYFHGVPGVLAAGLIYALLSLIYLLARAKRGFNLDFGFKDSLRTYLASAISAVPLLLILQFSPFQGLINLAVGGSIFLLSYLTVAPILGAVDASDIKNLESILGNQKLLSSVLKPVMTYERKLLSMFGKG